MNKGYIYSLTCNNPKLIYYGSTTQELQKRLNQHRCYNDCNSKILFYWGDVKINLIEEIEFEDKNTLLERESYYIKNLDCKGKEPLSSIKRDILVTDRELSIPDLFDKLIKEKEHIALVVDEYGSVSGLVSQEDVIETLLGLEIMDETDNVADLQALAKKSWKNRVKNLGIIKNNND